MNPQPTEAFKVENKVPNGGESYLNLNSDYIFDQTRLATYELWLAEEDLKFLNDDPTAEEYVEGTLIFEGDTISPVGIRYKGSIGAWVGCVSGSNVFDPSGFKTCTKLSMKIKINWDGRDEKFYDQKKLQFHSMNLDDSQLHERLGYYLFREMGVPAPRSVHARVLINGEFSGLYALTEQIDGRFTRYNYDDGEGNLYKEIWPLRMNGEPYPTETYIDALKTNEDEGPSAMLIRCFAQEIEAIDEIGLKTVIEKWMDIDKILNYIVVDRAIKNDDGAFHWYCGGPECTNHNYYWYEETDRKKLHLIPWDLDNAFENILRQENPVTAIQDEWGETRNNCQPFNAGFFIRQWSAGCDKLTSGWASYTDEYASRKQNLFDGPMSEANTDKLIDDWVALMQTATEEAQEMHDDAISVSNWISEVEKLKEQLAFARTQ